MPATRPIAILVATLGFAAIAAGPVRAAATADGPMKGVVGVCVRWGDDKAHVQEAVVVAPSKNSALNDAIPAQVKSMDWAKPDKDYDGRWVGVNLVFGEADPVRNVPDCNELNTGRRAQ